MQHKTNRLMRMVHVLISLFISQSNAVVAFPCQTEYNFNAQNFECSALIKDDVKCQIIDLHFQSEFVLFSEASEPENAHFKGCEDIAATGGNYLNNLEFYDMLLNLKETLA